MSIFISYKRENLQQVQRIVQGLRGAGLAVWWDQDIRPDDPWEQTIESELEKAKVVIVAWSQVAVASENVKAEARRARNQGKLIQIFVEPCDPPLFFGERQGVDLSNWNGDANDNRFKTVLEAARAILAGKKPPQGVGYAPKKRTPWATLTAVFLFASAILGFINNLGGARDMVCSLAMIEAICPPPQVDFATETETARQALLQQIVGTWRRQDRDCSDTVTYAVTRGEDGYDRIITNAAGGYESESQVSTVADGIITARTTTASQTGRELWEFHPDGDQLTIYDRDGYATTLVRCAR